MTIVAVAFAVAAAAVRAMTERVHQHHERDDQRRRPVLLYERKNVVHHCSASPRLRTRRARAVAVVGEQDRSRRVSELDVVASTVVVLGLSADTPRGIYAKVEQAAAGAAVCPLRDHGHAPAASCAIAIRWWPRMRRSSRNITAMPTTFVAIPRSMSGVRKSTRNTARPDRPTIGSTSAR